MPGRASRAAPVASHIYDFRRPPNLAYFRLGLTSLGARYGTGHYGRAPRFARQARAFRHAGLRRRRVSQGVGQPR